MRPADPRTMKTISLIETNRSGRKKCGLFGIERNMDFEVIQSLDLCPPGESYVERQDLITAAKAVGDAVHITWIAK